MKCINLRFRTKDYQKYIYCVRKKKQIKYQECCNCKYKEYKQVKELKKKTKKLKKLEDKRFSIITDNLNVCYICKRRKKDDLNEVFEGSNRQMSMKYGLVIPVCRECHTQYDLDKELRAEYQIEAQQIFEEIHSHELFMQEFKKDYIGKWKYQDKLDNKG